jgi:hypothetical protein
MPAGQVLWGIEPFKVWIEGERPLGALDEANEKQTRGGWSKRTSQTDEPFPLHWLESNSTIVAGSP